MGEQGGYGKQNKTDREPGGAPGKIPLIQKLGFKLSVFVSGGILLMGVFFLVFMAFQMRSMMDKITANQSKQTIISIESIVQDEKKSSRI